MKKYLFTTLLSMVSLSALASQQYVAVVDAGSSGTRLHLYQYHHAPNQLPSVSEISLKNNKVTPGIATYANHPADVAASMQTLFNNVTQELAQLKIPTKRLPLFFLATAGMRELPANQQADIYKQINAFIMLKTHFKLKDLSTLQGPLEGIYGWITVNYLSQTFQNHQATIGALDMGGASSEITFASDRAIDGNDIHAVSLGNQSYTVFTHSFLGLGFNEAAKKITIPTCYPVDYNIDGQIGAFNFDACTSNTDSLFKTQQVSTITPTPSETMPFMAFSGYYFMEDFFIPKTAQTSPETIKEHVQDVCKNNWETLKKSYPSIPEKYLSLECFEGAYAYDLLTGMDGFRFKPNTSQISFKNKIGDKEIDWALGAAIYQIAHEAV